jgi:hypothetical protein
MKTQDQQDTLREVLKIVDMYEDENQSLAFDNAKPGARNSADFNPVGAAYLMTAGVAGMIGDAIREKFDLPAKIRTWPPED